MVKNSDESKYVYSSYGIAFAEVDSWSFGNDFTWNVVIFDVGNNSSPHAGNC